MNVPAFFTKPDSPKRNLISFSEIDVARDLMDFTFVLRSDIETDDLKYYLSLADWTETHLDVLVNFTEPMLISKGLVSDQVIITIKNKNMFVSNITGKSMEYDKLQLYDIFPRQLPKGVNEEDLASTASTSSNAMKGLVFVQIFA